MRLLIIFAVAAVTIGLSYSVGTALIRASSTPPAPAAHTAPAAATLSPHEIHLNYKRMKELPVHDVKDAF
jgi:hypothetical protein